MGVNKMPKPRIARGSGPSGGKSGTGREYKGQSGSKSPEGARPVPPVARGTSPKSSTTGGGRRAVKPTPMHTNRRGSTAHRNR